MLQKLSGQFVAYAALSVIKKGLDRTVSTPDTPGWHVLKSAIMITVTTTTVGSFRLGTLWMYEAPSMFWAVWTLVSPFIHPETKEKVHFVSSKSAIAQFQQAFDPSVRPASMASGQLQSLMSCCVLV